MDENQGENSSIVEDDVDEIDTEAFCLETNNFMTETSSYPKISAEVLKRQPLKQRKEHTLTESKEPLLSPNQNKETEVQSIPNDSLTLSNFSFILIGLAVILCGVCVYFCWAKPSPSSTPNKQLDVQKLMSDLKSRFDGQPSLTYRVIEAAVKRASSENSESPGIIVLISSKKTEDITNELANRLVQLVSDPLHSVLIDSRYPLSAEQLKKEIDVTIRGNLTEKQIRAVLVRNLDQIPFEAAMIFHSYCDHENAPFKRAIYVMTAFVKESIPPTSDSKHWDVLASQHLKAVWSESGEDQVASLISRLTVNVAAVVSKVSQS